MIDDVEARWLALSSQSGSRDCPGRGSGFPLLRDPAVALRRAKLDRCPSTLLRARCMHLHRRYTLVASCPDRVGIVARVAGFIAEHQGWILETAHHADIDSERYFMRIEIKADSLPFHLAEFRERFAPIAEEFRMDWRITDSAVKKRVVVLVSKQEHCLYDLLARWQSKELDVEIPCVISNHRLLQGFVEWHGIPFHYVPVTADNKSKSFDEIGRIFDEVHSDVMVLARYMQILPPDLCAAFTGRLINIHHSFLPPSSGRSPTIRPTSEASS